MPESFNYQAIPRNASGSTYPDQAMKIKISILSGSQTGSSILTNEPDPFFGISTAYGITNGNIANWNTAFGWENHTDLYHPIRLIPAWRDLTGKPSFGVIATNRDYYDITYKPALFNFTWNSLIWKPATIESFRINAFNDTWASLIDKPAFSPSRNYLDLTNSSSWVNETFWPVLLRNIYLYSNLRKLHFHRCSNGKFQKSTPGFTV